MRWLRRSVFMSEGAFFESSGRLVLTRTVDLSLLQHRFAFFHSPRIGGKDTVLRKRSGELLCAPRNDERTGFGCMGEMRLMIRVVRGALTLALW